MDAHFSTGLAEFRFIHVAGCRANGAGLYHKPCQQYLGPIKNMEEAFRIFLGHACITDKKVNEGD